MKILSQPGAHQCFGIRDKLIWTKSQMGRDIVCLPWKAFLQGRRLVKIIIDQAHSTIGHYSQSPTSQYIWRYYWWPSMGTDIELFCSSCAQCQTTKDTSKKPSGLLHSLPIPSRPWQSMLRNSTGVIHGYGYPLNGYPPYQTPNRICMGFTLQISVTHG